MTRRFRPSIRARRFRRRHMLPFGKMERRGGQPPIYRAACPLHAKENFGLTHTTFPDNGLWSDRFPILKLSKAFIYAASSPPSVVGGESNSGR